MCETPPKIGLAIFPSKERAAQLKRSPAQARPKTSSWFRGGSIFGVAFVRGDRTRKAPTKQCLSWYSWVDSNHRPPDPQSGALNQLSYSCTGCTGSASRRTLKAKVLLGKVRGLPGQGNRIWARGASPSPRLRGEGRGEGASPRAVP